MRPHTLKRPDKPTLFRHARSPASSQLDPDYNPTASDTCGGLGAFCNDVRSASLDMTADEAQSIFDGFCQSGCGLAPLLSPLPPPPSFTPADRPRPAPPTQLLQLWHGPVRHQEARGRLVRRRPDLRLRDGPHVRPLVRPVRPRPAAHDLAVPARRVAARPGPLPPRVGARPARRRAPPGPRPGRALPRGHAGVRARRRGRGRGGGRARVRRRAELA